MADWNTVHPETKTFTRINGEEVTLEYQFVQRGTAASLAETREQAGNDQLIVPQAPAGQWPTLSDIAESILRAKGESYNSSDINALVDQLIEVNDIRDARGAGCDGVHRNNALIWPGQVLEVPDQYMDASTGDLDVTFRMAAECAPIAAFADAPILAPVIAGMPESVQQELQGVRTPVAWIPRTDTARDTAGRFAYYDDAGNIQTTAEGGVNSYLLFHNDPADRNAASGGDGYSPRDGTTSGVNTDETRSRDRLRVTPRNAGEAPYSIEQGGGADSSLNDGRYRLATQVGPRTNEDGVVLAAQIYRTIDRDVVENPMYRSLLGTRVDVNSVIPFGNPLNRTAQAVFQDVAATREGVDALNMLTANFKVLDQRREEMPEALRIGSPANNGETLVLTAAQRQAANSYFNLLQQNLANPIVWDGTNREGLPGWDEIRNEMDAFIQRFPEGDPSRVQFEQQMDALGLNRGPDYIGRDPNEYLRRAEQMGIQYENPFMSLVDDRAREEHVQDGLDVEDRVKWRDIRSLSRDDEFEAAVVTSDGERRNSFTVAIADPNEPGISAAQSEMRQRIWDAAGGNPPSEQYQEMIRDAIQNADVDSSTRRGIRNDVDDSVEAATARYVLEFEAARELLRAEAAARDPQNVFDPSAPATILRGATMAERRAATGVTRVDSADLVGQQQERGVSDLDSSRDLLGQIAGDREALRQTLILMAQTDGGAEAVFRLGQIGTARGGDQANIITGLGDRGELRDLMRDIEEDLGLERGRLTTEGRNILDIFPNLIGLRPERTRNSRDNQQETYEARLIQILETQQPPEAYARIMDYAATIYANAATTENPTAAAVLSHPLTPRQQSNDRSGELVPQYEAWLQTMVDRTDYQSRDQVMDAAEEQESIQRDNFAREAMQQREEIGRGDYGATIDPTRGNVDGVIRGPDTATPNVAALAGGSAAVFATTSNARDLLLSIATNDDPELARVVLSQLRRSDSVLREAFHEPETAQDAALLMEVIAGDPDLAAQVVAAIPNAGTIAVGEERTEMELSEYIVRHLNTNAESEALAQAARVDVSSIRALQEDLGARQTVQADRPALLSMESSAPLSDQELAIIRENRALVSYFEQMGDLSDPTVRAAVAATAATQMRAMGWGSDDPRVNNANFEQALATRIASSEPSLYIDMVQDILAGRNGSSALQASVTSFLEDFRRGGDAHAELANLLLSVDNQDDIIDIAALTALMDTPEGRSAFNELASRLSATNNDFNALLSTRLGGGITPENFAETLDALYALDPEAANAAAQAMLSLGSPSPEEQQAALENLNGQMQSLLSEDTPAGELITLAILGATLGLSGGGGGVVPGADIIGPPIKPLVLG